MRARSLFPDPGTRTLAPESKYPDPCTLGRASDMDRPSHDGTTTSTSMPTSDSEAPVIREPAVVNSVSQRLARWLLWLLMAAAVAVGVASRTLDSLPAPPAHATVSPSVLYDRYGTPIAEIGPSVTHASVGLEDVAPALVDAIVAVLDPGFLSSDGVDAGAYTASLERVWKGVETAPEGDGIIRTYLDQTQGETSGVVDEVQMLLAELRLGRQLPRPEILERFVNVVYLGRGAYGVHAAATAWYGIPASDLTVTQAAFLASLIDAPAGTDAAAGPQEDPYRRARLARDRVLVAMYEHGVLTADELATGRSQPVEAAILPVAAVGLSSGSEPDGARAGPERLDTSPDGGSGLVKLLDADADLAIAVGNAYAFLADTYGRHRVITGGLHVTTTVDLPAQRSAVRTASEYIGAAVAAEVIVLDRSGDVRVLVSMDVLSAAGTSDGPYTLRQRPLGDLLGAGTRVLQPLVAPDIATDVIVQNADVAQVAAAFAVLAGGGEARTSRIVLDTGDTVPRQSLSGDRTDRWPMNRTHVLDADISGQLLASMETLTLQSGVAARGRAGISPESGDAWFAGWTSHYTAVVRITTDSAAAWPDAAAAARDLFVSVLSPLQYAPQSS